MISDDSGNSTKLWIPLSVLVISLALGMAQTAVYYPKLPEKMATHFNAQGVADGFSSKSSHLVLTISLQLGIASLLLAIAFLGKKLPTSLVNLPHKEYWLADDRKETTWSAIQAFLLWITVLTQLFFIAVNQLTILENLDQRVMGWIWLVLGIYLLIMTGILIKMYYRFRLPKNKTVESPA